VREIVAIREYPERFSYVLDSKELVVGTGRFGPVTSEVWEFEVSGLRALQSWLGHRMAGGRGRTSSPLDAIRPERWTFSSELLMLIAILQHTIDVTPQAGELLERITKSRVIDLAALPEPTTAERTAPSD
jgi:hypothetical protein